MTRRQRLAHLLAWAGILVVVCAGVVFTIGRAQ